jgi:esterase/lipase superfamily enzyme
MYLRRRQKVKQEGERRSVFLRYLGEVAKAVSAINGADSEQLYQRLLKVAQRKTAEADVQLDDRGRKVESDVFGDNVLIVEAEEVDAEQLLAAARSDRITGIEPPDLDFPSRFEIDPPTVRSPANRPVLDRGFTRVEVFYATDRARGGDQPETFYTDRRRRDADRIAFEFGTCEVSVPYKHRPGEIERPSVWRLEFREDPAKHVVLLAVKPMPVEDSLPALRARVAESESQSALVFVHGFNVPFAAAARRTAQMKYDLNFDGAVLLYSWPAPQNYLECQDNEIWTRPHLIELLKEYVQKSGAKQIHLVAHSMGTRVLSNALVELADSQGGADFRYNQIILAAPDIDAEIFKQRIAPRIVDRADRISIYASSKDLALVASKKAHNNIRLGEGGPNITVFPGMSMIEVVDASNINESLLGHSYYGDSPTILRDLRLLLSGQDAPSRGLLAGKGFFLLQRK